MTEKFFLPLAMSLCIVSFVMFTEAVLIHFEHEMAAVIAICFAVLLVVPLILFFFIRLSRRKKREKQGEV